MSKKSIERLKRQKEVLRNQVIAMIDAEIDMWLNHEDGPRLPTSMHFVYRLLDGFGYNYGVDDHPLLRAIVFGTDDEIEDYLDRIG